MKPYSNFLFLPDESSKLRITEHVFPKAGMEVYTVTAPHRLPGIGLPKIYSHYELCDMGIYDEVTQRRLNETSDEEDKKKVRYLLANCPLILAQGSFYIWVKGLRPKALWNHENAWQQHRWPIGASVATAVEDDSRFLRFGYRDDSVHPNYSKLGYKDGEDRYGDVGVHREILNDVEVCHRPLKFVKRMYVVIGGFSLNTIEHASRYAVLEPEKMGLNDVFKRHLGTRVYEIYPANQIR